MRIGTTYGMTNGRRYGSRLPLNPTFLVCAAFTFSLMALTFAATCQTTPKTRQGEGEKGRRGAAETQTAQLSILHPTIRNPQSTIASVRLLLEAKCLGCHGVGNKLGGLDLRSRSAALKGGGRGAALVPGHADKSLLFQLVNGNRAPLMPPTGKLAQSEIAALKAWLNGGAAWPSDTLANARKQVWWSFKPPVCPSVPRIQSAWIRNPIDAFVLAGLRANGLQPSPPASRRILIRRAYYDLIGLPPTPAQVEAFVRDTSPDAWAKVVDSLLASPRYGERWGRHWLDLARYADSGGFEGDKDRALAWRYRDYVIDAFNQDKPYNEFLREQIAGDELRPSDPNALVATGYLACGPQDIVENNARTRANELDDLVATTGSVMLGLTVGCARCHDHKYDPVKQTDYYRLSAIFAPTERREVECASEDERRSIAAHNAPFDQQLAPLRPQADQLRKRGEDAAKKAGQAMPTDAQILAALPAAERNQLTALQQQIKDLEARRRDVPHAQIVTDKSREFPASHLLLRGDAYHPGEEVKPGFVCALPDGQTDIGPAPANGSTTGRRTALANWLTAPQNPLVARVWVNRVWRQHFGRGLVNTPSNFGLNGELPSHPELLDWLACHFVAEDKETRRQGDKERENRQIREEHEIEGNREEGKGKRDEAQSSIENRKSKIENTSFLNLNWRLKPLHRLMLLSSTYQQASEMRRDGMKADPQDKWYWRMPVRRLEAEPIRDSILTLAGTLNLQMGGQPVYPPIDPSLRADTFQGPNWQDGEDGPSTWRRSVYVKVKRSTLLPELEVFDCPEITYTVAQRNVTTTPLQALMLLNDPLIVRQASLFAQRLQQERPNNPRAQIEWAYQLAFGRAPSAQELSLSLAFLQKRGVSALPDFCHALFNLNEFVYVP